MKKIILFLISLIYSYSVVCAAGSGSLTVSTVGPIGNQFTPQYNSGDGQFWTMTTAGFDAVGKISPAGVFTLVDGFVGGGGGASPSTMAVLPAIGSQGMVVLYDCNYGGRWFTYDTATSAKSSFSGTPNQSSCIGSQNNGVSANADGSKVYHHVGANIYLIDPLTVASTLIATNAVFSGSGVFELDWDASTGTLLAHGRDGAAVNHLYRIDVVTGAVSEITVPLTTWGETVVDGNSGLIYFSVYADNIVHQFNPISGQLDDSTLPAGSFSQFSTVGPARVGGGQSLYGQSGIWPNEQVVEIAGVFPIPTPGGGGSSVMVFQPSGGLNDGTDQGGANSGKDTFDLSVGPNNDNSASPQHHHFNSTCNNWWGQSYYQFDLSTLPAAADTTNVKLIFYHNITRGYGWPYQTSTTTMQARSVTSPWSETGLTYNNRPSIAPAVVASVDIPTTQAGYTGFVTLDITNIYKDWKNGVIPNYGIAYSRLQAFCENANSSMVFSSDNPDPTRRPRLEITYNAAVANQPPVANAGAAQALESAGATTAVTLDGSASTDPDGDPLTYSWADAAGNVIATGASPVVNLANGVHTISLSVADGNGGTSTASTSVTVQDTIAPVINISPIPAVEAVNASGAVVDVASHVTATDVCAVSLNIVPAGTYALGSTTVTITATDCAGNSISTTTSVTVQDTTAPSITAPAQLTIEATGNPNTSFVLTTPALATDAVGVSSISNDAITNFPSGFPFGTSVVTWTAIDGVGNTATATQNVRVVDTTAPALSIPANVSIEANAVLSSVTLGTAMATDIFAVSVTNNAPATYPLGITVVTWLATDANGNVATGTQNVNVLDSTAPVVTAQLIPLSMSDDEHSKGMFKLVLNAIDIVDPNPAITAMLNGTTVSSGQIVRLEQDDDAGAEFEHGRLEVKGIDFSLYVSATDVSGNTAHAMTAFVFPSEGKDRHRKEKKSNDDDGGRDKG